MKHPQHPDDYENSDSSALYTLHTPKVEGIRKTHHADRDTRDLPTCMQPTYTEMYLHCVQDHMIWCSSNYEVRGRSGW